MALLRRSPRKSTSGLRPPVDGGDEPGWERLVHKDPDFAHRRGLRRAFIGAGRDEHRAPRAHRIRGIPLSEGIGVSAPSAPTGAIDAALTFPATPPIDAALRLQAVVERAGLTPLERDVLAAIGQGESVKQTAGRLGKTPKSIKKARERGLAKCRRAPRPENRSP